MPDEIIQKWQKTITLPEPGLDSLRAYEVERSAKHTKTGKVLEQALVALAKDIHCGSRGGNWQSPLWFCGYEPGGYLSDLEGHQYTDLEWAYCSATDLGFLPPQFASSEHQGIGCDCNLYPVQRPSHEAWHHLGAIFQGVDFGQLGDYALSSYPDCILEVRRDAFREYFDSELKHHPIVIIANGELKEFLEVLKFKEADKVDSPQKEDLTENVQVVSLGFGVKYRYDVTLITMPHFGSHGLTLEVLEKRARIIHSYLLKHDTKDGYWHWWFEQYGQRKVMTE